MKRFFIFFYKDDEGAVTVDWVVLCAAVVALGLSITATFQSSSTTVMRTAFERVDNEIPLP